MAQSMQKFMLLKDLDLELEPQQRSKVNKFQLEPLTQTPLKPSSQLDSYQTNNQSLKITQNSFKLNQQSQKSLKVLSPLIQRSQPNLKQNLNIFQVSNSPIKKDFNLNLMQTQVLNFKSQSNDQFQDSLLLSTTDRQLLNLKENIDSYRNLTQGDTFEANSLIKQGSLNMNSPDPHSKTQLQNDSVSQMFAKDAKSKMRTSYAQKMNSISKVTSHKQYHDPYMHRHFLKTQYAFQDIDEMSRSRNNDIQALGSLISQCSNLNKNSTLSPIILDGKKRKGLKKIKKQIDPDELLLREVMD